MISSVRPLIAALLTPTALLFASCVFAPAASADQMADLRSVMNSDDSSTLKWRGAYSGSNEATIMPLQAERDWIRAWAMAGENAPMAFDTDKYCGVAIFLGQRPTGGYRVEILSAKSNGAVFEVEFAERTPTGFVTQAQSTPWLIQLFPRTQLPMILVDRTRRKSTESALENAEEQIRLLEDRVNELQRIIRGLEEELERIRGRRTFDPRPTGSLDTH